MLRVTKRFEYALIAIRYIGTKEGVCSAKEIASETKLSYEFLCKALQRLAKEGIIISEQGVRGGYRLAKAPADISFYEISHALGESIQVVDCVAPNCDCEFFEHCCIKDAMLNIQSEVQKATTPMDKRVLDEMLPYMTVSFGNAASRNHAYGWEAESAVDIAREQVAKAIGASAKEIVFTSGATESINIAIKGIMEMYHEKGNHIITCMTEHKAVLDVCHRLEREGKATVTYLQPQKNGIIDLEKLELAFTNKTVLVAIMFANNEIGVIQPVKEIGAICRKHGAFFFCDGVQAVGKVHVHVEEQLIDMLAMSGHKIYGPKGIGALYVRRKNPRVKIQGLIDGGGQERGMRSGTLNVPGIVGLGKALELCIKEIASETVRLLGLRNKLLQGISSQLDEVYVNGSLEKRLPGNLNISYAYVEGEGLMMGMSDIAVSSGSACTSASLEPSHVLKALGVGDDLAHSSIRYGLGRFTTENDVEHAIRSSVSAVKKLREMSPLYEMAKAEKVLDHYHNPRNVGSLNDKSDNVGTGIVGAPECGDVMKLQIQINEQGIIEEAKFKTFGCGSAIASSSLATEMLKGKSVNEAFTIKNTEIVKELNLPPVKIHCSVLAEDAIKAAVEDFRKKQANKMQPQSDLVESR
ncbi:hypothetical protein CHS0354_023737 [Potamilus streckersoni]|uniref:Iron-sulfur cluster assembly enzyme ISCU n=1 Tax=Potamilus streckersoni TaxID=2493646 RepID=A0AAE0RYR6_9BIVA|nr:hypothetical protein CHS0354_023737 [Potamilus streckersoni]